MGQDFRLALTAVTPEYRAVTETAGWLDLSGRGRLCLLGADREKFLHGQVTNDILKLQKGQGTYAALVNAKGRIEADLFVYKLADELLLDFEPGLSDKIAQRLEKFVIAEDVQIVDVALVYGLLTVQGPRARDLVAKLGFEPPASELAWAQSGESYLMRNNRYGTGGFDLFVPREAIADYRARIEEAGAAAVSETAAETVRIENGIPRFGFDMDESNLAPETGLERRAISYAKGCYIGQEVIARIRTYGQVAKALRVLRIDGQGELPARGTKLIANGKEVGYCASFTNSPKFAARIGFGYVRKEVDALGATLQVAALDQSATIIALPFG